MQPAPNDNRLPPAPQPGVAWPGAVIANSAAQLPGMPGMPLQMPMLPQSFPTMPGQHAPLLTQHQAPLGMPLPGRPAMPAAPGPAMLNPHGAWGYGCSPNGCTGGPYCSKMDEIAYPFVMKHLGLTSVVEDA